MSEHRDAAPRRSGKRIDGDVPGCAIQWVKGEKRKSGLQSSIRSDTLAMSSIRATEQGSKMTKQELYRDLCKEAGTYTGGDMPADQWYDQCSHNITPDLDAVLQHAAEGDTEAIAESRQACGLPIFA